LPITDSAMTRFNILIEEGVELIFKAIEHSWGGEIFVPKIPSFRVIDLATAIDPEARQDVVGVRPGEKLHEEMVTRFDAPNTVELDQYYAILPASARWDKSEFMNHFAAREVASDFSYNSETNTQWLSVEDLRRLIKSHVDTEFTIEREVAVGDEPRALRI